MVWQACRAARRSIAPSSRGLSTGCPSSSRARCSRSGSIRRNLVLLDDEQHRTVVLLLAFTGFRVSSVVTLARDAREFGPDGHPYLRYFNIKAKRQAMLPIAPALSKQLERQEELLIERYPQGTEWLLPSPPPGRRDGKAARSTSRLARSMGS